MEKSIKHLLNLIKDNPDLPVKIMVNGQALSDGKTADGRTIYYEAEIGDSEIREFALNTWSSELPGNGEILFRDDYISKDDREYLIGDIAENKYDGSEAAYAKAESEVLTMWQKVIVVTLEPVSD